MRQRNKLFEKITDCGYNPADFHLRDRGSNRVDLVHPASDSVYNVWRPDASQLGLYNLRLDVGGAETGLLEAVTFGSVVANLGSWLPDVEYQSTARDLWAELREAPEVMAAAQSADASNEPFTADEQAEIIRQLDEVKQLVKDRFDLNDRQIAAVNQRVDEVKEEVKHQGRRTFLYTFYGAMMSTFMTDEVPAPVVQAAVITVLHGIAHLFGIGGPPPVIGG